MYALVSILFFDAGNRIVGTGQAHTVYPSVAKKAPKGRLRGARVVCDSLVNTRPSRAPQSHAGLAG